MGHAKLIISGDIAELYEYAKDINPNIRRRRSKRSNRPNRAPGFSFQRRIDNQRKTRRAFIRTIATHLYRNGSPALLTLTFAEQVQFKIGIREWGNFIRLLRHRLDSDIQYAVVPEFQLRGTLHFHALVWGIKPSTIQRERLFRTLQNHWAYGFCDLRPTDGSPRLAGYLAKYMLKALYDVRLCREKAYYFSRGIMRPVLLNTKTQIAYTRRALSITGDNLVYTSKHDNMWLGEYRYSRYKIK